MWGRIKNILRLRVRAEESDWFFAFVGSCLLGGMGLTVLMAIMPEGTPGWPLLAILAVPVLRVIYGIVLKVSGARFDDHGNRDFSS